MMLDVYIHIILLLILLSEVEYIQSLEVKDEPRVLYKHQSLKRVHFLCGVFRWVKNSIFQPISHNIIIMYIIIMLFCTK